MSIDVYKKIAATVVANCDITIPNVLVITSSSDKVDYSPAVNNLGMELRNLNKKVFILDARITCENYGKLSDIKIGEDGIKKATIEKSVDINDKLTDLAVKKLYHLLKETNDMILVIADPIESSQLTMLFCALSNGVILAEKKKISRTDEIDKAVSTINNLNANPLGFILL